MIHGAVVGRELGQSDHQVIGRQQNAQYFKCASREHHFKKLNANLLSQLKQAYLHYMWSQMLTGRCFLLVATIQMQGFQD